MSISVYNKPFSFQQAASVHAEAAADSGEQAAIAFLNEWLGGSEQFQVQTSGSTGIPKTISISRQQMLHSAQLTTDFLHLSGLSTCLVPLGINYIAGKMLLVRALQNHMHIDVVKPGTDILSRLPADHTYELASFVPLQLEEVLHNESAFDKLQRFKIILVGGSPLSNGLERKLATAQQVQLWHTYGMTETVSHIALRCLNGAQRSEKFSPLPGIQLRQNGEGCLAVQAQYLGPDWIQTTDMVEMYADGFRVLGRADEVINSGGIKIFPSLLEQPVAAVLASLQMSNDFFLGPLQHDQFGQQLVLVLEGKTLAEAKKQELLNRLKEALPVHQTPRLVFFLDRFLRTANGKLQKTSMLEKITAASK